MSNRVFAFSLFFIMTVLAVSIGVAQSPLIGADSVEVLQKQIGGIIDQPRYAASFWGVDVVSLDSGKVLFEQDAGKLFTPASNSKLYTMALALTRLGPDYRIKTSLYSQGPPDASGTLSGDLVIYGRGDPTISGEYNGGNVLRALEPLVAALTNAGVKQIQGDLVGDESYFRGSPFGAGWTMADLDKDYGAEISALTVNSNIVQLVVKPGDTAGSPAQISFSPATDYLRAINHVVTGDKGTARHVSVNRPIGDNTIYVTGQIPLGSRGVSENVTVHNPAGWFTALFKEALASHGITVTGKARTMNWLDRQTQPLDLRQWSEIGSVQSRPFREIIRSVEKASQNLYTDLMLAHVGVKFGVDANATSEQRGIRELNQFLAEAGIHHGETIFDEGSGLSRENLTTPHATIQLLTYMSQQKNFDVYRNALPIAGVDGTLAGRFKGTVVEGNLRAKTGSLRWANSLSGYLTNAAGERLVLCIMLNRVPGAEDSSAKTKDIDTIAEMVAGSKFRTAKP